MSATFNIGKEAKVNVESCIFTSTLSLEDSDVIEAINNIATGLNTLADTIHDFVNKIQPPALSMKPKDEEDLKFSVEDGNETTIADIEDSD